jgi:periplasmic protein TonB
LATYRLSSPYERPPLQRRLSGFALALGVNLLLLLILLGIGGIIPVVQRPKGSPTLVVDLMPKAEQRSAAPAAKARVTKPQPARRPQPPKIPPIHSPIPSPHPLPWLEVSHDQLAAADLRNLPKADAGTGDSEEVGRGPNGEVLYAAEWAREPTDAELGGYLPKDAPDGSGLVACKTIPGDRVEDCIELANDPPGSHLARAVRLAAWQFRVRPPRRNGKPLVGSWVRIEIEYIHGGAKDE